MPEVRCLLLYSFFKIALPEKNQKIRNAIFNQKKCSCNFYTTLKTKINTIQHVCVSAHGLICMSVYIGGLMYAYKWVGGWQNGGSKGCEDGRVRGGRVQRYHGLRMKRVAT